MVTLILESLAGGFLLAGVVVGIRAIVRRRRENLERRRRALERRRLSGLGSVDAHRERYR
jgi:hypothetical protein